MVNEFKDCAINVSFATWKNFLSSGSGLEHLGGITLNVLLEGEHSGIKTGHEQQKFRDKKLALQDYSVTGTL